jgi:beta-N-acetylhexosaminidase
MLPRFFSPLIRLLGAAFLVMCVAGTAPPDATMPTACDADGLDAMIGQLIMVGFPGDDERQTGVAAVREQLAKGVVGGVVIYPDNIAAPQQLRNLIAFLRNAKSNPVPFIAVDQEGGKVQRLAPRNGFRHFPSAASVARDPSFGAPGAAERLYAAMAEELAETGFNMNFGPVVDLNLNPDNPVIGARNRSFGADPNVVTELARAFVAAHRKANVVTVAKHFPGHGSSDVDSHTRLADVSKSWSEIELEPYRRLAREGLLDAVMIGHLYHPRFSDIEGQPASLSAKAVRALRAKDWIGFDGVVVSDDLEMGAVRHDYAMDDLVTKAINAGTDLLVFSNQEAHDPELGVKVHAAIAQAACAGRISRLRIEQAYAKVVQLKQRLKQKDLAGKE